MVVSCASSTMSTTMRTMMASPAMRFPLELKLAVIEELILEKSPELESALSTIALVWPDTLYFIRRHRFEYITLRPHSENPAPFDRILRVLQDPVLYSDITQMIRSLSVKQRCNQEDPYLHPRFPEFIKSAKRLQRVIIEDIFIPSTSLPFWELFRSMRHITILRLERVEMLGLCELMDRIASLDSLQELQINEITVSDWEHDVFLKRTTAFRGISFPVDIYCVEDIDVWCRANIDGEEVVEEEEEEEEEADSEEAKEKDSDENMSGDDSESESTTACGHIPRTSSVTFSHLIKLTLIGGSGDSDKVLLEYFALKGKVMFPNLQECVVNTWETDYMSGMSYPHVQNLCASLPDTVKYMDLYVQLEFSFLQADPFPLFPLSIERLKFHLQIYPTDGEEDDLSRTPILGFAQALETHASLSSIPLYQVDVYLTFDFGYDYKTGGVWRHVRENMSSLHRFDRALASPSLGVTRCVLHVCFRHDSEVMKRWVLEEGLPNVNRKFFTGGGGFVGEWIEWNGHSDYEPPAL